MKINKILTATFASLLLFSTSCRNNDEEITPPKGAYENGIFISNEGNFGKPNASVSFISNDLATVENNIYGKNNGDAQLGDVLQSVGLNGDNAYLVLNNSNKVEVVNRYTFKKVATVTENLKLPRYIAFSGNNYYVTNSSGNTVTVYNTAGNTFVKKIDVGDTVERIVEAGGKIFVQNAAWGTGKSLTIINPSSNNIDKTFALPEGNIQKTVSHDGFAYVLTASDSDSYIYKLNPSGAVTATTKLTGVKKASNLQIAGNKYIFSSGAKIYAMEIGSATVPAPIITQSANSWDTLYGFSVVDGKIFTSNAKGFTEASEITVYDTSGKVLKTFTAGMGTNGFYKN